jgi:tetratricopeptide (TPR) repeat protein
MLDLLASGQNKLSDPILMNWALRRFQHAQTLVSERCHDMERAWFHDISLRHWIDSDDHDVLADLFYILPSRLFVNLRPAVLSRWNGWTGEVGAHATNVLKECSPEQVLPLLARHFGAGFSDLRKTYAAISCLADLPSDGVRQLLDEAIARVDALPNGDPARAMLLQALLRPVAVRHESAFVSLAGTCVRTALDGDRTIQMLKSICSALLGNDALMDEAKRSITCEGKPIFGGLWALFHPDAPLNECDRIFTEADFWPKIKSLLERHRGATPAAEKAAIVCALFEAHTDADPADLASFAVAAVLSPFERVDVGADALSMEDVLNILSLNVAVCRHSGQLAQRLRSFEPGMVARALGERLRMRAEEWGGIHLAAMAGELRLGATVPALIDCLADQKGDYLCEAAEKALARIGTPAEQAVIEHWDDLDRSQKIYGRSILEKIGGEATCRFALDRFEKLFREDHEGWCSLIEACPDDRAIGLLETQLGRKQPVIDRCFYRLCILADRHHAGIDEVRGRIEEHRRHLLDHQSSFEVGALDNLFKTLTLTLRCEKCGDVNRYDIKSVVVGSSGSHSACFVRDDLRCLSCGQWADFDLTAEAHMQMMAALLVRSARPEPKQDSNGDEGPFQLIDVTYRWQKRPAPDVMAELKSAVQQHPLNIVNHLRMARMQYIFGRRGRAEECYRRALQIEPNSMEAGLGLAQTLADAGQQRDAFDQLDRMLQHKSNWRFFRTDELTPNSLSEEFANLFNKLHSNLGVRHRPLLHANSVQTHSKVGRNDPCPCGSGMKYKKCCGASQAARLN